MSPIKAALKVTAFNPYKHSVNLLTEHEKVAMLQSYHSEYSMVTFFQNIKTSLKAKYKMFIPNFEIPHLSTLQVDQSDTSQLSSLWWAEKSCKF